MVMAGVPSVPAVAEGSLFRPGSLVYFDSETTKRRLYGIVGDESEGLRRIFWSDIGMNSYDPSWVANMIRDKHLIVEVF